MKIISWNVNGIRAIAKKGFIDWLDKESPEVLCIQETKASPEQLPEYLLAPSDYTSFWDSAERKGYSGVAIYTKEKPLTVIKGLGKKEFDSEGRTLLLELKDFYLFNIYFPNGSHGNVRVPFKMKFYGYFLKITEKLKKKGKGIIICGDVNTAHKEIDLARPKENEKNTGFLSEERAWIDKFLSKGYVDTWRHFNKAPGHYTWWDYKTGARARNVGWRIDYFFITDNLLLKLKNAFIMKNVSGSDHCPIGINIK